MKKYVFVAVMLAAWYAGAQQSSQQKSEPAQPQSVVQPNEPKSENTAPPEAHKNAQPPDKNATSDSDKDPGKRTSTTPAAASEASKGCLAVKPAGSHVLRNVMLAGVAGALISKEQYKVVDVVNYPVSVGTKFHGDALQTISSNGTKVVILDKHAKEEDVQKACH